MVNQNEMTWRDITEYILKNARNGNITICSASVQSDLELLENTYTLYDIQTDEFNDYTRYSYLDEPHDDAIGELMKQPALFTDANGYHWHVTEAPDTGETYKFKRVYVIDNSIYPFVTNQQLWKAAASFALNLIDSGNAECHSDFIKNCLRLITKGIDEASYEKEIDSFNTCCNMVKAAGYTFIPYRSDDNWQLTENDKGEVMFILKDAYTQKTLYVKYNSEVGYHFCEITPISQFKL